MCADGHANECVCLYVEPDNDAFPVMCVSEKVDSRAGLVLVEVPAIHQRPTAAVLHGASVHLGSCNLVLFAIAIRVASVVQAAAVRISRKD